MSNSPKIQPSWAQVLIVPLLAGLVLGIAGPPFFLPFLVLVAWIPFVSILLRKGSWGRTTVAATVFGLGQNIVLAWVLEFPLSFALALIAALTLSWAVLGLILGLLLPKLSPSWALLVIPLVVTVIDGLSLMAIPVFGTAQSFVRALVAWPWALATSRYLGHGALVFLVVAIQTGFALAFVHRKSRFLLGIGLATAVVMLILGAIAPALDTLRPASQTVRVAAVGWTYQEVGAPDSSSDDLIEEVDQILAPLVETAARQGAALVVAPEVSFFIDANQHQLLLDHLSELASSTQTILVVGYFDRGANTNQAVVITADGEIAGEYRKTHLIPGIEDYTAGDGTLLVVESEVGRLGVMICQDDNFTDLALAYAKRGVQVMVVPTNDWRQVQEFHLQNAQLRAASSGFSLVRGSSNGISAIIDAGGRILARRDHHSQGRGFVVADLPIPTGGALHATLGEALIVVCVLILLILSLYTWRKVATKA